jgi:serine/threonine-protein kinase HipA
LPLRAEAYEWRGPSPFFMGLLPEGWLPALAIDKLKLAADDWFGKIQHLCRDCIGAVHVEAEPPRST